MKWSSKEQALPVATAGSETQSWVNHNQHITDKLEELVQAIKHHPNITSCEQVCSLL